MGGRCKILVQSVDRSVELEKLETTGIPHKVHEVAAVGLPVDFEHFVLAVRGGGNRARNCLPTTNMCLVVLVPFAELAAAGGERGKAVAAVAGAV